MEVYITGGLALRQTKDTLATRVVNLTRPHPFVTENFRDPFLRDYPLASENFSRLPHLRPLFVKIPMTPNQSHETSQRTQDIRNTIPT